MPSQCNDRFDQSACHVINFCCFMSLSHGLSLVTLLVRKTFEKLDSLMYVVSVASTAIDQ
jgi:hypothetical protein